MTFTTYTAPPQRNRVSMDFAPKVERKDINEAMPYDYIAKIVVITNGEIEHTAKFISAKFAEVYGGGVTFDFRHSELSGNTVMVMLNQRKADRFNNKQLNDRINEIETVIGEWL